MFQNETGIKVYEQGDVVTFRTGKTLNTVTNGTQEPGSTMIASNNSGRTKYVESDADLNLVINVRDTDEWKARNQEALTKEYTAYQKAVLFALNVLGKHVYAGTVRANVKAKRRSLNKRQDQSRKANR